MHSSIRFALRTCLWAGLLTGAAFVLVLLGSSSASADDGPPPPHDGSGLVGSTIDHVDEVTDGSVRPVTRAVAPLTDPADRAVRRTVEDRASTLAPAADPVRTVDHAADEISHTVARTTRPVVTQVSPTVAPVARTLAEPLRHAAKAVAPVVDRTASSVSDTLGPPRTGTRGPQSADDPNAGRDQAVTNPETRTPRVSPSAPARSVPTTPDHHQQSVVTTDALPAAAASGTPSGAGTPDRADMDQAGSMSPSDTPDQPAAGLATGAGGATGTASSGSASGTAGGPGAVALLEDRIPPPTLVGATHTAGRLDVRSQHHSRPDVSPG